ncbi:beta-N-acetylhexosaminidase [Candidatus Rariloculus sp.]|uniref:beta-N-acetylhexosaminidase n=1 Tax=Candidatus Rariloculus sp. TaxID=3101265 RepID=UPI003D1256E9
MSLGPLMIGLSGTSLEDREREWLASPLVGGVILFARNFSGRRQLERLVEEIQAIRSPPLLVGVDQEGGRVQRFGRPFSRLPPARAFGRLYDEHPSMAERSTQTVAWLMAAELRAVGVDLSFAPVVDLDSGVADVIGDRALHASHEVVSRLALRVNAGLRDAGMVATAKHFPTHAGARSDSHNALAVDHRDHEALCDDLVPYRRLINAGLHSIMVGHVIFPELDPLPASLSPWWIETQLRGELRYSGAVISDDMGMAGASVAGGLVERVRKSLDAGCDLVLVCNELDQIPALLAKLDGYVNPSGQLRLMRLRGADSPSWDELRASSAWQEARAVLDVMN